MLNPRKKVDLNHPGGIEPPLRKPLALYMRGLQPGPQREREREAMYEKRK